MNRLIRRFLSTNLERSNRSKWVKIGKDSFRVRKIERVKLRRSFFHIWHPFVMELKYHEPWSETVWVWNAALKISVPHTIHHEYKDFKYKYKTKESACQDFDKLYESGAEDVSNLLNN